MNNTISVKDVKSSAADIKNQATSLNSTLNSVKTNMKKVSNAWRSNAQEDFSKSFHTLESKFQSFYEAVNEFGNSLNKVAEIYEKFDKNVSQSANKLSN